MTEIPGRYPVNLTAEVTVRCNLQCRMCMFRHSARENSDLMRRELTAQQWIQIAREAAAEGCGGFLFTGGEPLFRNDFPELYQGIYQIGFMTTLYTNATLVSPEMLSFLKNYPPHKIGVTIYGADEKDYKSVCGNSKAFGQTIEGIHRLLELPSLVEFRSTVIQDTVHRASDIVRLVKKEFGPQYDVTFTRMVMRPVRGGCSEAAACRLSPEDNVRFALRMAIQRLRETVGSDFNISRVSLRQQNCREQSCQSPPGSVSLMGCSGGMTACCVTWDGKLQACQMLDAFQTNAAQDGFSKAWHDFPKTVHIPEYSEQCSTCSIADLCQCCPASRAAETGSISGCPDYACQDAFFMHSQITEEDYKNEI